MSLLALSCVDAAAGLCALRHVHRLCDPSTLSCPRDSPGKILEWVTVPSSGDLPNPGMIEFVSPASPEVAGSSPPGKPFLSICCV